MFDAEMVEKKFPLIKFELKKFLVQGKVGL